MLWWILCALGAIAIAIMVIVGAISFIVGIFELLFCN